MSTCTGGNSQDHAVQNVATLEGLDEITALKRARLEARLAVAERLRLTADSAAWLEWEADRVIDAIRRAVEARGGHVEMLVRFHDVVIQLEHFGDLDNENEEIEVSQIRTS